jgi:hypothetical protein
LRAISRRGASGVELRVRLRNATPRGEVDYIAGTRQPDLPFGTYRALVTVYLPASAFDLRTSGGPVLLAGDDGPMRAVGLRVDVPRAGTREVVLRFSLPRGQRSVLLLPDGRWNATTVSAGGRTVTAGQRRIVRW